MRKMCLKDGGGKNSASVLGVKRGGREGEGMDSRVGVGKEWEGQGRNGTAD